MGGLLFLAVALLFLGLGGSAAIIFGLIYGGRRAYYALKGETYRPLLTSGKEVEYVHQDTSGTADIASLKTIFRRYLQVSGVGKYAREGMIALDGTERKISGFYAMLDSKFQPGSITWEKFSAAASAAKEAVLRNCAELANAIQLFDNVDFRRLEQEERRTRFRRDVQLSPTQLEKQQLYRQKLGDMQAFCDANERILLELDKLALELDRIDDAGSSAESEHLIEEIRTLTAETKYYKDALDNMD